MNLQIKTLIEALDKPSTLEELVQKTQYPVRRVLAFIEQARAEGINIRIVHDPSVVFTPTKAQPCPDAFTSTYEVHK